MNYDETDLHHCEECGSEFIIQEIEAMEELTFCPYCGTQLYGYEEGLDEDLEKYEKRSWD